MKRYGVRSVCLSTAANQLLQVCCCGPGGREISTDAAAAGECGQCHVVSVRRQLDADLV